MKWEPPALMVLLLALGAWLAFGIGRGGLPTQRPGAQLFTIQLPSGRGAIERVAGADGNDATYRVLMRDGFASPAIDEAAAKILLGEATIGAMEEHRKHVLFRWLNITSWAGLAWVLVGLGGQIAFSGRMLLQWFASEKSKESIVSASFWWWSLIGGVLLFAYFVWRQDIVGVLGQSSGIVVYARNLRLITKARRRAADRTES